MQKRRTKRNTKWWICHFGEGEISIWEEVTGVVATGASPRPWMSYGSSCPGVAGRRLPGVSMLKAATIGEILSGMAGTDVAAADADSVGVVVCSSSVATPPHKLFGNVAKNSVNASWATWNNASLATGVLSSGGGVVGPYGRGMVRSYVGRLIGWAVSSSFESNSSSWYGSVSMRLSSSCSVSSSSSTGGEKSSRTVVVGCWAW